MDMKQLNIFTKPDKARQAMYDATEIKYQNGECRDVSWSWPQLGVRNVRSIRMVTQDSMRISPHQHTR